MSESPPTASRMSSNSPSASDLSRPRFKVLGSVVNQVIDAECAQFAVLGGRRSSDDLRADVLGDLGRSYANGAACGMNEDCFVWLQSAHDDHKLPGGEVVYRDRRALLSGHALWARKDLAVGHANNVA